MNKEKETFIEEFNKYQQHLLVRLENAEKFFKKNPNIGTDTRQYKAYEEIVKELSQLEDMKIKYSLFKNN